MNGWKGLVTVGLAAVLASRLAAEQKGDDEESKLLAILAEETAVATKTRLNSDFVPGIVTVLHGEDLEALGVETVWEALSLVPGVEAVRDGGALPSMIVRGLEFPFNAGNVKILVDGISVSRENAGINGITLYIPIQEVDRIEVIRGPGSVVYGDFAFMGLVNVVTKRQASGGFVRYGGDKALSGGGHATQKAGPWEISVAAAGFVDHDAPATADEVHEKRGFGDLNVTNGGLSLTAEAVTRRFEPTLGTPAPPVPTGQTHWTVDGRYAWDLAPAVHAQVRASTQHDRMDAGVAGFTGTVAEGGLDMTWTGLARHSALFAADYAGDTIDSATEHFPVPPGVPPQTLTIQDKGRDTFGLTLQDTFEASAKLTLTAGLRYDRASSVGARTTPRVAVVYRVTDGDILKVQYAEGFRRPTFFELYDRNVVNPTLGPEVNKTAEVNYVLRRPGTAARATLFYTKLVDMIFVNAPPPRFGNFREARADGIELEWEREISTRVKAGATLSWVDVRDNRNAAHVAQTPPVTASWLGNATLLFRAARHTLVGARWNWVGERNTTGRDNRGYQLVDLTVTQDHFGRSGIQLRAGVKNLFDDDTRYFQQRPDGGGAFLTFPGRTFFVQLAYGR